MQCSLIYQAFIPFTLLPNLMIVFMFKSQTLAQEVTYVLYTNHSFLSLLVFTLNIHMSVFKCCVFIIGFKINFTLDFILSFSYMKNVLH